MVNARFQCSCHAPPATDRAIFSCEASVDTERTHLSLQNQVVGGLPAIDHLASVDQASSRGAVGLHEKWRQSNAPGNQEINRLGRRVRKPIAERAEHGHTRSWQGPFKKPGATSDGLGEQVGSTLWGNREK
jgi:hypothetical protein